MNWYGELPSLGCNISFTSNKAADVLTGFDLSISLQRSQDSKDLETKVMTTWEIPLILQALSQCSQDQIQEWRKGVQPSSPTFWLCCTCTLSSEITARSGLLPELHVGSELWACRMIQGHSGAQGVNTSVCLFLPLCPQWIWKQGKGGGWVATAALSPWALEPHKSSTAKWECNPTGQSSNRSLRNLEDGTKGTFSTSWTTWYLGRTANWVKPLHSPTNYSGSQ